MKEGGYAEGIIEATEGDKVMKSPSHGGGIRIADNGVCQDMKSIRQNYTLLEQKGIISSIIDEIIKFEKT